ncbi:DUF4870 domain-containing protein [Paucisalibacillus globulus]|uniref:DUF4870 domain-containing protein n=1 Tax=Paucisalibacillus globulus TaxID=351095 RepID=UPI0004195776|nr:DUF4870 domain-containing protein [Paucisalibacillus globulus]
MSDLQNDNNEQSEKNKKTNESKNKTSSGIEENVAGLLCYLLGFVTGLIFLLIEKDNHFVRFHALQSIIVFAALFVLNIVIGLIPLLGFAITALLAPLSLVLWIVLMIQAYQGKLFKLPMIGDIVEVQLEKMKG